MASASLNQERTVISESPAPTRKPTASRGPRNPKATSTPITPSTSAIRVMRRLAEERPDILIGAGTVLDAETARMCILEGAQFVVSPALKVPTIEMCHRYGVAVLPGALTPTEIVTAWEAGADVVKIFPASALGGAKYLKSVKAPLPQVEMIPTGGVSLATAAEFLEAGAFALGVGADLVDLP